MTTQDSSANATSSRNGIQRLLERRHGGVVLFLVVFLSLALLTRCALLAKAAHDVTWDSSLLAAFGWGLLFDIAAAAWFSLPLVVLLTLLPEQSFANCPGQVVKTKSFTR